MGLTAKTMVCFVGITAAATILLLALRVLVARYFTRPAGPAAADRGERQTSRRAGLARRPTETAAFTARFDHWIDDTIRSAGLKIPPLTAALAAMLCGALLGATTLLATENPFLAICALLMGTAAVLILLLLAKLRRMRQFQEHFPASLDLLARAVRAGESLDQGFELLGTSAMEPVAGEFRRCSHQLNMGLSVSSTMKSLVQRIELMDVRIFASTLTVHRESGGNLPGTLERLAQVIRDRLDYQRKLRSITGAARISVWIIAILGPLLFTYFYLFQPQYGNKLWADPLGRSLLMTAIAAECLGIVWVWQMLKSNY